MDDDMELNHEEEFSSQNVLLNTQDLRPLIIGLTSYLNDDIKNYALKCGMNDIYEAPMTYVQIQQVIMPLLENRYKRLEASNNFLNKIRSSKMKIVGRESN
jgi:hypothetical protein